MLISLDGTTVLGVYKGGVLDNHLGWLDIRNSVIDDISEHYKKPFASGVLL